ncbi:MAG: hypothetical protein F4Y49_02920 [Dehalococcoidia bacterium]|nr:hypothetical protein [Dehalococcoidia bacterium]
MTTAGDVREYLLGIVAETDAEIARLTETRDAALRLIQELDERESLGTAEEARKGPAVNTGQVKEPTYKQQVAQAIVEVLTEEQPLHREVIRERVEAKGIPLTARKPIDTIAQRLTSDDRFVNVVRGKGIWALRGYESQNPLPAVA